MRLSDGDLSALTLLHDFDLYYEQLSAGEMIVEVERLHTNGHKLVVLHQHLSMHRRFVDIACFDQSLTEQQRSAVIGVVTSLRDTIDRIILPEIDAATCRRAIAALAASDDYMGQYGYYPRAVEMIRLGARNPVGPYELGPIGEILA